MFNRVHTTCRDGSEWGIGTEKYSYFSDRPNAVVAAVSLMEKINQGGVL